jgi:hypothetical protein
MKNKVYRIIYREFEELGDRSYHPTSNDDALRWATRLRNKNIPPSPEEIILLKAFSAGQQPATVSGYYPTLALVGGATAGAVLENLFLSADAAVRAVAAETCNHGIFSEATAALGKLLGDPSQRVRNAAHQAMPSYANWRSQAAQQIPIQRATTRSLNVDARIVFADALAEAVKLQASGVQQDPPMFKALIELLRDDNDPMRAMAFLALTPIRDYIVGGSNAGQFPPAGGWQKWLDRITAEKAGDLMYYRACEPTGSDHTGAEAMDHFCAGGALVSKNPAEAFQKTLKAARGGYVLAQEVVGMMYAIGKGIQQDYRADPNYPRAGVSS